MAWSPDGNTFAAHGDAGIVNLWNMSTCEKILQFRADADADWNADGKAHDGQVTDIVFSPDGKMLATSSRDGTAKLWDVASGRLLHIFDIDKNTFEDSSAWSVAFSPDGNTLATGTSGDHLVILWDVPSGQIRKKLYGHKAFVNTLAFSRDGTTLASASQTIRLWDVDLGEAIDSLPTSSSWAPFLSFSPDGAVLAASHERNGVKLWQLDRPTNPVVRRLPDDWRGPGSEMTPFAISTDGTTSVIGTEEGRIEVYDMAGNTVMNRFSHGTIVYDLDWIDRGRKVVSSGDDGKLKLWNADSGQLLRTFECDAAESKFVGAMTDSRDRLYAISQDLSVSGWDLGTSNARRKYIHAPEPDRILKEYAISRNGKWLATSSVGRSDKKWLSKIWDTATDQLIATIPTRDIRCGQFSPDESLFAWGNRIGDVILSDVVSGKEVQRLTGHNGVVRALWFSPNGRRIYCGDMRTVKAWDLLTGTLQFELEAHDDSVCHIHISADSRTLTTVSTNKRMKQWHAVSPDEVRQIRLQWQQTLRTLEPRKSGD
jgi:WD40 repeat protein